MWFYCFVTAVGSLGSVWDVIACLFHESNRNICSFRTKWNIGNRSVWGAPFPGSLLLFSLWAHIGKGRIASLGTRLCSEQQGSSIVHCKVKLASISTSLGVIIGSIRLMTAIAHVQRIQGKTQSLSTVVCTEMDCLSSHSYQDYLL